MQESPKTLASVVVVAAVLYTTGQDLSRTDVEREL